MVIDLFQWRVDGYFLNLIDYHKKMEAQIPIMEEEEFKKIQKWKNNEQVDYEEYCLAEDGLNWSYKYFIPRSLRYSFIVLLYSIVETQLREFCNVQLERRKLQITLNAKDGQFIESIKSYCYEIIGIPKEKINWQNIEDLSKIRNCIVHTNGNIRESRYRKFLYTLISQSKELNIGDEEFADSETLNISSEYCLKTIEEMQQLFKQLFEATEKKI